MISVAQFLIGGFWTASVSVGSWGVGLLMGLGLAKLASLRGRPRNDVDELLRKEQATRDRATHLAAQAARSTAGK